MKFNFDGKKCIADYDENDPKEKLEKLLKRHKNKKGANFSKQDAEELGRAFLDAQLDY